MDALLIGGVTLLAGALLLLWAARALRRRSGMPAGKVIYSDTRAWRTCSDPLYAPEANLTGKPDYLVEKWRHVLPVEVKSRQAPPQPYRSHILQLAAYCRLVQEEMGLRPPYGIIHYADRTFAVRYTRELENELLDTLAWMREDLGEGCADRNHNDPTRCRSCGYAFDCDQRLD
jgi:CRISPR-associated exonuclease Cas4